MNRPRWRAGDIVSVLCSPELRHEVLKTILSEGPQEDVDALEHSLARLMRFRGATMRALPLDRKIAYVRQMVTSAELQEPLRKLLVWFHLERRRPLLCAFLDHWGILHQQGNIDGEAQAPSR